VRSARVNYRCDLDNLFRVLHRQRTKHDCVHQAKHGGVGANTECEREYGDDSERRRFEQQAKPEAYVS
jgi:hypothetical protein